MTHKLDRRVVRIIRVILWIIFPNDITRQEIECTGRNESNRFGGETVDMGTKNWRATCSSYYFPTFALAYVSSFLTSHAFIEGIKRRKLSDDTVKLIKHKDRGEQGQRHRDTWNTFLRQGRRLTNDTAYKKFFDSKEPF
jgi:hypothetical protein